MGFKKWAKKIAKTAINPAAGFNPARKALKNTSVGRRLESTYDVAKLGIKDGLKDIKKNPVRLLVGSVDPASTKLWNKALGRDDRALVNMYGSPTKDTFAHAEQQGINTRGARDFFKIGDSIAGAIGGSAAVGGLSNAYGAATAGSTGATGVGGLPVVNGVAPNALTSLPAGGIGGAGGVAAGGVGGGSAAASGGFDWLGQGSQLLGAGLSAYGQIKGAKEGAEGAQAGIDEQRRQFDLTREDFAPYRTIGTGALGQLGALNGIGPDGKPTNAPIDYSAFTNSPGYQFNMSEGLKGVENSAAASGGLYSGRNLKALQERGAGIASQGYGDYYNRLAGLAGVGQTATSQGAQLGQNNANNVSQLLAQQGDIRGSGLAGGFNAIANGIGSAAGMYYGQRYPNYYGYGG